MQNTIYKINSNILLHSTGNYIQPPVINHNGKEYEKEYMYVRITDLLCYTLEANTIGKLYFSKSRFQKVPKIKKYSKFWNISDLEFAAI